MTERGGGGGCDLGLIVGSRVILIIQLNNIGFLCIQSLFKLNTYNKGKPFFRQASYSMGRKKWFV